MPAQCKYRARLAHAVRARQAFVQPSVRNLNDSPLVGILTPRPNRRFNLEDGLGDRSTPLVPGSPGLCLPHGNWMFIPAKHAATRRTLPNFPPPPNLRLAIRTLPRHNCLLRVVKFGTVGILPGAEQPLTELVGHVRNTGSRSINMVRSSGLHARSAVCLVDWALTEPSAVVAPLRLDEIHANSGEHIIPLWVTFLEGVHAQDSLRSRKANGTWRRENPV